MRPKLQIALDVLSIETAKNILTPNVINEIDIVEIGTLLLAAEGKRAVTEIRKHIGDEKLLVADFKIADGAGTLAQMFFKEGADLTTVIAAANLASMEKAQLVASEEHKELQIELYGRWDMDLAKQWYDLGLRHIIFHHARDGAHVWNQEDVEQVRRLHELGYCVSVTGGLNMDCIRLFESIPVYAFIIGRTLYQSSNTEKAICEFKSEISKYFPEG